VHTVLQTFFLLLFLCCGTANAQTPNSIPPSPIAIQAATNTTIAPSVPGGITALSLNAILNLFDPFTNLWFDASSAQNGLLNKWNGTAWVPLVVQPANGGTGIGAISAVTGTFFAGPATGSPVAPVFRTIVPADLATALAIPPPIGATTPNSGTFTTLVSSGPVSGLGFSNYFLAPPPIGATTPNTVAATTLSASGTLGVTGQATLGPVLVSGLLSGVGVSNYLSTPPPIGVTTPNTGSFTTLTLPSQTANNFFAAPDGSAGVPAFRAFVLGDVPALSLTNYYLTLQSLSPVPGKGFTLTPGAPLSIMETITTAAQEAQGGTLSVIKKSNETSGGAGTTGPTSAIYGEVDVANGGLLWNQAGVTGIAVNSNTTGSQPVGSSSAIGIFGAGICHVANCVATWGANISLVDDTTNANPPNLMLGQEITFTANGGDSFGARYGLLITANKYAGVGAAPLLSHGISIGGVGATYGNLIDVVPGPTVAVSAIDLRNGIYSGGAIIFPQASTSMAFYNAAGNWNGSTIGTTGSSILKGPGASGVPFLDNYDGGGFSFRTSSFGVVATIGATPGASTKTVCSDAVGNWFAKAGTC